MNTVSLKPMNRYTLFILFLLVNVLFQVPPVFAQEKTDHSVWYTVDDQEDIHIHLYFFWSKTCPHCKRALSFLRSLEPTYPWLRLHMHELSENAENVALYVRMTSLLGVEASYVPAFLFCEDMVVGYASDATTGESLRKKLLDCYQRVLLERSREADSDTESIDKPLVSIPFLGQVDPSSLSLPVITFVIGGLDAFNPCAFFVLLFLLSLLIHAQSRLRMLLVGAIFVLFSGVIYFLCMAAWLNLFLLLGSLRIMTVFAGAIALGVSLINIKDYFWWKRGTSLSIPEYAKPTLYKRMRGLVNASKLLSMLFGTVVLALTANLYELLCTAGFPMVYTRILTLHHLQTTTYYAYLVLYNLVYVLPLMIIVLVFTFTLGSRKLTEDEGRILKLLSGLMMFNLGLLLLFAPERLNSILTAALVLAIAIIITGIIVAIERLIRKKSACKT